MVFGFQTSRYSLDFYSLIIISYDLNVSYDICLALQNWKGG